VIPADAAGNSARRRSEPASDESERPRIGPRDASSRAAAQDDEGDGLRGQEDDDAPQEGRHRQLSPNHPIAHEAACPPSSQKPSSQPSVFKQFNFCLDAAIFDGLEGNGHRYVTVVVTMTYIAMKAQGMDFPRAAGERWRTWPPLLAKPNTISLAACCRLE